MSDQQDPYQAPKSHVSDRTSLDADAKYTAAMVDSLRATKPWVRFLSILGFILSGLVAVSSFGFFTGTQSNSLGGAFGPVYLISGLFYLIPSIFLFRYASAIARLLRHRKSRYLEEALGQQKSFWKFLGILTLVMMILWLSFLFIMSIQAVKDL